jgi:hypothetical protein
VQPNDWQKQIRTATRAGAVSGKRALYLEFLERFLERVRADHPEWTNRRAAGSRSWFETKAPIRGCVISSSFPRGDRLRQELYIDTGDGDQNDEIFGYLRERREQIEEAYGTRLEWEERAAQILIGERLLQRRLNAQSHFARVFPTIEERFRVDAVRRSVSSNVLREVWRPYVPKGSRRRHAGEEEVALPGRHVARSAMAMPHASTSPYGLENLSCRGRGRPRPEPEQRTSSTHSFAAPSTTSTDRLSSATAPLCGSCRCRARACPRSLSLSLLYPHSPRNRVSAAGQRHRKWIEPPSGAPRECGRTHVS